MTQPDCPAVKLCGRLLLTTRLTDAGTTLVLGLALSVLALGQSAEPQKATPPTAEPEPAAWAPPDIDAAVPPVETVDGCPVEEVLQNTSNRVKDLALNLQRFAAKEHIEYEEFEKNGNPRHQSLADFTYVALIREAGKGQLAVEEYRNDTIATEKFPTKLATTGIAAFALIFHPDYVHDFDMRCEGKTSWHGRSAWQVRFEQRKDVHNNFRGYRIAALWFPVKLKGRGWIAADTFEVVRLETDLLEPIKEIPLEREHTVIDYGPVAFPKRKLELWVPQRAEIYMDYRGRRYRHRHSYSDFQLFLVETEQKTKAPKAN